MIVSRTLKVFTMLNLLVLPREYEQRNTRKYLTCFSITETQRTCSLGCRRRNLSRHSSLVLQTTIAGHFLLSFNWQLTPCPTLPNTCHASLVHSRLNLSCKMAKKALYYDVSKSLLHCINVPGCTI